MMRKNSIRKLIHGILDLLPLFVIPIFAININQKSVEPISIEVQENQVIDFNQKYNKDSFINLPISVIKTASGSYNAYSTNALNITYYFAQNNVFTIGTTYICKIDISNPTNVVDFYIDGQYWYPTVNDNITHYEKKFNAVNGAINVNFRSGFNYPEIAPFSFTIQVFDLNQMDLVNITINEFNNMFTDNYYPYTQSKKLLVNNPTLTTYDNTDIGSQFLYSLYISTDKYFNMNNVFNLNSVYQWFEMNIFNGTAPLSIYIVWNIIIYELVMDLLMLLYALFMFFIDACQKLIDKPLNSIK